MATSEKLKALLQLKNIKRIDLANYLQISNQSLSNKFTRGSFSTEDLIKVCEFANSKLCIEVNNEQKIYFSSDDIRQESQ